MSMISSLIDKLNKSADEWNGSNMFELARMCREAADTIWELRDDLQRANAENAKLREEFDKMDVWHSKELSAAMAEIGKLRELVRDYERCTMHADCSRCEYDGKLSTHCPLSPCFPDTDKLDEMVDASDSADDRCEKLADLADCIRKLAKEERQR